MKLNLLTKITSTITLFLISLFVLNTNLYAGFGVSPSDIIKEHAKPGDHYEKTITISRSDPDEDLKITIDTELDGMEDWFVFDTGREFIFEEGESRKTITAIVDIPKDADFDKYTGSISIKAGSMEEQTAGVSIVKGARLSVHLVTTSIDVSSLLIRTAEIEDHDQGEPLYLAMLIENSGNVDAGPSEVELDVTDLNGNPITSIRTTKIGEVPVGETNVVKAEFETDLKDGEYFGNIKVYLGENLLREDKLFFRVNFTGKELTQETTEKSISMSKELISIPYLNDNTIYILAGLALIALLILIILITVKKKKDDESNIKYLVYIVGVVFVLILLSLLATVFLNKQVSPNVLVEETPVRNNTIKKEDLENYNEEVKGVSTKANTNRPNIYNVYESADIKSTVVYSAQEGEKLKVLGENRNWYKVVLANGKEGWIQKTSIKN